MVDRLRAFAVGLKRLLLAFVGLVIVALLAALLLAPTTLSDFIVFSMSPVVRILIVVLLSVIVLAIAFREFRQSENQQIKGLMVQSSGALTVLSVDSARERVLDAIRSLPDVHSAHVDIEAVQGRARITLNVVVDGKQVNLPEKQREINRALEQVIEKQLGLRMAERPKIQISFSDVETMPEAVVTTRLTEPEPARVEEAPPKREVAPSPGLFGKPLFGRNRDETVPPVDVNDVSKEEAVAEATSDDDDDGELWSILAETSSPGEQPSADELDEDEEEEVAISATPTIPLPPREPVETIPDEPIDQFEDSVSNEDDTDIGDIDIDEEIVEGEDEVNNILEFEDDENDVDDDVLTTRPE